jgi:hypothetical protein
MSTEERRKISKEEIIDFNCDPTCCALTKIYPNSDASLACDTECYFCKEGEGRPFIISYMKRHFKIFRECIDFKNKT